MSLKIFKSNKYSKDRPQNNFYDYVNSNWTKQTIIPTNKSSISNTEIIKNKTNHQLKEIIIKLPKKNIIKKYYNSFTNIKKRNKMGFQPIIKYLNLIDTSSNYTILKLFLVLGIPTMFDLDKSVDLYKNKKYFCFLTEDNSGLPVFYYKHKKYKSIQLKYKELIKKIFKLIDEEDESIKIYKTEKKLAEKMLTPLEQKDFKKLFNKVNRKNVLNNELNNLLTAFNIPDMILIDNLNYFKYIQKVLQTDLKSFFKWKLLLFSAQYLSEDFTDLLFNFYNKSLLGIKKKSPCWLEGINFINMTVSELLGEKYRKKHFTLKEKNHVTKMIKNIKESLKNKITNSDFMTSKTKKNALLKIKTLKYKVGYPKKYNKYKKLKAHEHPLDNLLEYNKYCFIKYILPKINKKINKTHWEMDCYRVNAYYEPVYNQIVIPAGILQPPYYDINADNALNYGAIGTIIGHELTHGFDDTGKQFNENGIMKNWWIKSNAQKYTRKLKLLITQYDNYKLYNEKINGKLTIGENIADLEGFKIAFDAFLKLKNYSIDNVSPEKRFFIAFAISWRSKQTKKALLLKMLYDTHSPAQIRVNGVLSNIPQFYKEYCVHKEDEMYRHKLISFI
tara:strand:- start:522 stop:2366 length:1845 start_codon:yes stop_codon:yes gene_type:complete